MKKAFGARRVPRKVGDDEEIAKVEEAEPSVKSPTVKPRKSSNFRSSFGIGGADDDEEAGSGVVTPKRSNVSRIAIQRNASKRSSLLASSLPTRRADDDENRPAYTAASLQELKDSTPFTPQATVDQDAGMQLVSQGRQELDLSSKFGSSLSRYQQPSAIPSAAEIAEKKARRARMAKEQVAEEYISLDPDDPDLDNEDEDDPNVMRDGYGKLVLKPKDKYNMAESRLVHEDEDIMENFDEFTEDGKMHLGRKAEGEAARQRRADMAAQIAQAEGDDSDSDASDASEKERNAAFEAAQTRHGTYAANGTSEDPYAHLRPNTPPKISPLPTLDSVIERLRRQLGEMQSGRLQKLKAMEELQREKIHLGEEEIRIQKALKETAEKFQEMRREKGLDGSDIALTSTPALEEAPTAGVIEQQAVDSKDVVQDENMDEDEDKGEAGSHSGLGLASAASGTSEWLGAPNAGLGMVGMSMRPPSEEYSDG
ncbi:Nineteen complex-related protein 2 [Teratosphaeria destructans]|uniref:Nineteen complex-related protein 2 n=1 Tax=Teratosphaeria destructans TaxID=418781 RepID=A0A9W7VYK9_9PEZI|nr:Nineteen complex-related protein 2 [Teratosphaeria destructans]